MAGHNLKPVFIELDVERYRVIPRRSCGSSLSDQPVRTSARQCFVSFAAGTNENFDRSYSLFTCQGPAMLGIAAKITGNEPPRTADHTTNPGGNFLAFYSLGLVRCCSRKDILSL